MTGAAAIPQPRLAERREAIRHSRRVKRLRVVVPALGAVFLAGLIGAAALPKLLPLSALAGLSLSADGLVMNSPSLSGHLGNGRRYEVGAERAVQSLINPSRLSLDGLLAELDLGDGERATINGAHAAFDTDTEVLTLEGGVALSTTSGNDIALTSATVSLKDGRFTSNEGIRIFSPKGEIVAQSIDITNSGDLIRLTGGVSIVIQPGAASE